jgi:hypothetical protein
MSEFVDQCSSTSWLNASSAIDGSDRGNGKAAVSAIRQLKSVMECYSTYATPLAGTFPGTSSCVAACQRLCQRASQSRQTAAAWGSHAQQWASPRLQTKLQLEQAAVQTPQQICLQQPSCQVSVSGHVALLAITAMCDCPGC